MAPVSGDDPYITWPPHVDPQVEQIFREANRAGYVIFRHGDVYTLVSPGMKEMQFLGRVVSSSAIWRHMVSELRDWLEQTMKDEPEGQGLRWPSGSRLGRLSWGDRPRGWRTVLPL